MASVKVQYAKTHLSALLASVEGGDEIIIARGDRPVAKLVPVDSDQERELGFVSYAVPPEFFEPLSDDELSQWEDAS